MKPLGWMDLVSLDRPVVRVDSRKLDIFAEVVAALEAEKAVAARHTRLDCDPVTRLEVRHALAAAYNDSRCFVADDTVPFKYECPYPACLPEVYI